MYGIFLDIETTGLDPYQHRPIDLAFRIVDLSDKELIADYQQLIFYTKDIWDQYDPESLKINGYTYEDTLRGKNSEEVSVEVIEIMTNAGIQRGNAFFICQNPAFDRAFFDHIIPVYTQEELNWPYHWLDLASIYWALMNKDFYLKGTPMPETIDLSKNAIAQQFSIPIEKTPHRAMNGVQHLMQCYYAVITQISAK